MGLTLTENQLHNAGIVQRKSYESCDIHRRYIPLESAASRESFEVPDFKDRSGLEMADILRQFEEAFRHKYGASLSSEQLRAMAAILRCRTPAMGGHIERCNDCNYNRFRYKSCRNRHCSKCRSLPRAKWTADREAELLDTVYFHLVFKLPTEIAAIALQNKDVVLDILFQVVKKTLMKVAADPQYLGVQIGVIAALHTWGQRLEWHPHLHCLLPGGGLSPDGQCVSAGPDFLPVDVLATVFRSLFLKALKKAFDKGELQFYNDLEPLREPAAFARYLDQAREHEWEVYSKRALAGPKQVLDYISRNAHSVSITNDRLVNMDDGQVTFKLKAYGDGSKVKTYSLPATEFLRRFILFHVMPEGFHTIRYGGFLGNKVRDDKLAQCRRLLSMLVAPHDGAKAAMPQKGCYDRYFPGDGLYQCPRCRDGVMVITELLPKVIVAYEGSINSS